MIAFCNPPSERSQLASMSAGTPAFGPRRPSQQVCPFRSAGGSPIALDHRDGKAIGSAAARVLRHIPRSFQPSLHRLDRPLPLQSP